MPRPAPKSPSELHRSRSRARRPTAARPARVSETITELRGLDFHDQAAGSGRPRSARGRDEHRDRRQRNPVDVDSRSPAQALGRSGAACPTDSDRGGGHQGSTSALTGHVRTRGPGSRRGSAMPPGWPAAILDVRDSTGHHWLIQRIDPSQVEGRDASGPEAGRNARARNILLARPLPERSPARRVTAVLRVRGRGPAARLRPTGHATWCHYHPRSGQAAIGRPSRSPATRTRTAVQVRNGRQPSAIRSSSAGDAGPGPVP